MSLCCGYWFEVAYSGNLNVHAVPECVCVLEVLVFLASD